MRQRLGSVMHRDAHNGAQGYIIRSLYFDTPDDQDFSDKIDGLELRRKIRLRTYSPQSSFAMLEMKQKQGPYQRKRSLRIAREDAQRLCQGDYEPLHGYDDPFAAECYGLMHCRPLYPVMDPFHMVLEVKYNGFLLSYIKDLLDLVERSELSVSKYCLGRGVSLNIQA